MGRDEEWRKALTTGIEARIRDTRKAQKITVEQLSERTRDLGFEIPRSTITNIESMRKAHVAVHEVVILAAALEVPPVTLLFDYTGGGTVEMLPDIERTGIEAVEWFAGNWPLLPAPLGELPSFSPFEGESFDQGTYRWANIPEVRRLRALRHFEGTLEKYHGSVSHLERLNQDLSDIDAGLQPRFEELPERSGPRTADDYREAIDAAEARTSRRLNDLQHAYKVATTYGATPPGIETPIREDAVGGDDGTATA